MKNIDIAKALGISSTSVSLALNNHPGVSNETRQRVLYLKNQDNSLPINLDLSISPISNTIIFAIHKKHGEIINDKPFFLNLVETLQQEAMLHSYSLNILHYIPGQDLAEYIRILENTDAAGIILLATEMDYSDLQYYKTISKPIVLLDSSFDLERFNSITINNKDSIFQAIQYAYNLGHRSIGYLKSCVLINNFEHRFDGYNKAIRYFHLEKSNAPIFNLHCNIDQAYRDMKRILKHKAKDIKMPSIFISELDYIALGAMRALKEFGYKIPNDISVIGFDDIAACEVFDPPLTTLRVNQKNMAILAIQKLMEVIESDNSDYTITQLSTNLIIRHSTAPPSSFS